MHRVVMTTPCPELNCPESEQVNLTDRCCKVCRGMGKYTLLPIKAFHCTLKRETPYQWVPTRDTRTPGGTWLINGGYLISLMRP